MENWVSSATAIAKVIVIRRERLHATFPRCTLQQKEDTI